MSNETPPIKAPSPSMDNAASIVRTILLISSVVTALAGIISRRSWAEFIVYVQSSDFLTVLSLALGAATFAWGQWKIRHRAKQIVAIRDDARVPPDVIQ